MTSHTAAASCSYCPRCIDAGALGTLADLLPLIAAESLNAFRDLLLDEGRWSGLLPGQRLMRADLVDATARRLIAERGHDPESAIARGELYPSVPDTPESL